MLKNFEDLKKLAIMKNGKIAITAAHDKETLKAANNIQEEKIGKCVLFGDTEKIKKSLDELKFDSSQFEIVTGKDEIDICTKAVNYVREGKCDILQKGKVKTRNLLKVVLDKGNGLRGKNLLSDVFIFEDFQNGEERITLMSDGGVNTYPSIEDKIQIIENAVVAAKNLGFENVKVALLGAVEVVNPKMPPTIDAAIISKIFQRQNVDFFVDGPFALDNAIDIESAKIKGIESEVAGQADILIMPNIEAGNIFGKSLVYHANKKIAHIIVGAKAPIIIPSRSDNHLNKFYCMLYALASI